MTTVTFLTEESRIVGFEVSGHSGYADAGEDIVCAAVTSAIRLVDSTVNDVMGLCAAVKVNEQGDQHHAAAARRAGVRRREHLSEFADGADGVSGTAPRRVSRQHRSYGGVSLLPRSSYRKDGT